MTNTDSRSNGAACHVDLVSILRCGEIDIKRDVRRIAQMVWDFTLLMSIFFRVVGMSRPDKQLLSPGKLAGYSERIEKNTRRLSRY